MPVTTLRTRAQIDALEDQLSLAGDALAQLCQRPATAANLAQIAALAAKIGALAGGETTN